MTRKDIQSSKDGVTRDMVPEEKGQTREFRFPALGVTVKAETYYEALKKAKKQVNK